MSEYHGRHNWHQWNKTSSLPLHYYWCHCLRKWTVRQPSAPSTAGVSTFPAGPTQCCQWVQFCSKLCCSELLIALLSANSFVWRTFSWAALFSSASCTCSFTCRSFYSIFDPIRLITDEQINYAKTIPEAAASWMIWLKEATRGTCIEPGLSLLFFFLLIYHTWQRTCERISLLWPTYREA